MFPKKTTWRILLYASVTFGAAFMFLFVTKFGYEKIQGINNTAVVVVAAAPLETPAPYFYYSKDPSKKPTVVAGAYVVGDLDTGEIILAKNEEGKFPIASVSKLMTATVSEENQNPEDITKVSKKALATEGTNGNFFLNEKVKIGDLLHALLLESSNDAAEVIAEHSVRDAFIEKMNDKAKELGLISTAFEDPSGLSPKNQSTSMDLFKLAQYTKKEHPDIFNITTQQSYNNHKHIWFSNNQFLNEEEYKGGKSGYTDEAKQTVVSTFALPLGQSNSRNIGITLLQTPDRFKDVENILKYLKSNVYYGRESDADASWVKAKLGIAELKTPDFVTLAFLGDIMLDRGVKSSVLRNFGGDYSMLFKNLGSLKKSDIVFANLQGVASDKGEDARNLYAFRMDPTIVPALKGGGISILSVANNHMGDFGRDAYIDTLARLEENEILYTGGGKNVLRAELPTIIEKNGIKIGFLGFSDKGPDAMAATEDQAGVLLASNPRYDEIIKNAKSQVDFLVVSLHFGEEYQTKHNDRQALLAHKAVDDGAKLVIGTHTHVIQDTEVYKDGYIAYSLGNFIFDQAFSQNTMQSLLLKIKLNKDGSMNAEKDTVKLNSAFQPSQIIKGKDEKVKFQAVIKK